MKLSTYIQAVGDEEAARLFGVKVRTVASWRRRERMPRTNAAKKIVAVCHGSVTMEDIYMD